MEIKRLNIKLRKPFYGFGINDSDYVTQPSKRENRCPIFDVWHSMLRRCYSKNSLKRNPAYTEVEVCEEWRYFSNFKSWMEKQDWENKALDKDWLGSGKIYSPDTCVFIPSEVNTFIAEKSKSKFLGVHLKFTDGREKPYVAQAQIDGKKKHLGVYSTLEEGHRSWQKAKLEELSKLYLKYPELDLRVKNKINKILDGLQKDIENRVVTTSLKNYLKEIENGLE